MTSSTPIRASAIRRSALALALRRSAWILALLPVVFAACDNPVDSRPDEEVAEVEIVTPPSLLSVGRTQHLTLVARTATGKPVNAVPLWQSSDTSVAHVGPNGIVTGVAPGQVVISVTVAGSRDEFTLRVTQTSAITLVAPDEMISYRTYTITGIPRNSGGETIYGLEPTWTVSDSTLITLTPLDEPVPTARLEVHGAGQVMISVEFEGWRATRTIPIRSVSERVVIWRYVPGTYLETVAVGGSRQLDWVFEDDDGNRVPTRPVTWSSSNPAAVEVDQQGVIKGIAPGEAVITVSADDARPAHITIRAVPGYTVQPLGFTATRVNQRGQVVGVRRFPSESLHRIILWEDGEERSIGPALSSEPSPVLNDAGQVAWTVGPSGYLWTGTEIVEFDSPDPAFSFHITTLGNDGTVYGYWLEPGTPTRGDAFLWRDGELTVLGRFGGDHARVVDVNAHGDMLITVWPQYLTFILRNGIREDIAPGEGRAISDGGDVVIRQWPNNLIRWDGTFYEVIAGRNQVYEMTGINSAGDVVGSFSERLAYARLWRRGELYHLEYLVVGDLSARFLQAYDVTESGLVLVYGSGGGAYWFLLTPQ